jgi:glycosyltransferase involved in cell wall biosynthesis
MPIVRERIKILHILWSGRSGGAERFVRDITVYSNRSRFEHRVCFLSKGGAIAEQMTKNSIEIYIIGMKSGFSMSSCARILKVIHEFRPHVIHSHVRNYLTNLLIFLSSNTPKLYFEHGGDLIGANPWRDVLFYKIFCRFFDLILTNSDYVRNKIVQYCDVNLEMIATFRIGIDPQMYKNSGEKKRLKAKFGISEMNNVIGTVCRLVEAKGVDDFIKVAREVQRMRQDIVFLIVGDGEKRATLEKMAVQYDVDIRFLGDRLDVSDLLSIFDIFLFTSKWESFGITVLEAMAAKVPVVGFAVGGAREIIDMGGGVLLEKRDHKKLAELAVEVLEDRTIYERLSAQGYANLVENFHIERSIELLEREYVALL